MINTINQSEQATQQTGTATEQGNTERVKARAITLSVARVRQNAKVNIYPKICKISSIEELREALKYDHVAGLFKDNHRGNNNFLSANCVIMDVDNNNTDNESEWITPESIKAQFPNVEFYTCYSRNHMRQKGDKSPRPRFHIYFVLHEEIGHAKRIRAIKEVLLKYIPDADAGAKDAARLIYGVESPEILYFAGERDIISFVNEHKASEADLFTSQGNDNHGDNQRTVTQQAANNNTAKNSGKQDIIPEGTRNNELYNRGIHILLIAETGIQAKELFYKECEKCEPKLPGEECDRIWQSLCNSDVAKLKRLALNCGDKEKFITEATTRHADEKFISMVSNAVFGDKKSARAMYSGRTKKKPVDINVVLEALNTFGIRVRNNKITQKIEVDGIQPGNSYMLEDFHMLSRTDKKRVAVNALPGILMPYLQNNNYTVNLPMLKSYINTVADVYAYNPVEDMLNSQEWDGQDRLAELYKIMGITENAYYCRLVKKWLIQAVAMAFNDDSERGCDFVLVLQGAQGVGKTEFFRNIAMRPEWFYSGADIDTRNKDSVITALSVWICEIGEADATFKHEQAQLKSFITNNTSIYRRPYGETYEERPRRTVFGATVNPEQFLKDTTGGSRRWATIRVHNIDSEKMRSLSKDWYIQMWTQIYNLYLQNNEGYRLDNQERAFIERENQAASEYLPGELELYDCLDWEADISEWRYMNATQFLVKAHINNIRAAQISKAINKIMQYDKRVKYKAHGKQYLLPPLKNMEMTYRDVENIPDESTESTVPNNNNEFEGQQPESQISIVEEANFNSEFDKMTTTQFGELEFMNLSYREIQNIYFTRLSEVDRKEINDFYRDIFFYDYSNSTNKELLFAKYERFEKACRIHDDNSLRDEHGKISGYVIDGVYKAI